MGKPQETIREPKKQAAKTPKEKKAIKHEKKHPVGAIPVIAPGKV
jgi:hypothetical protein